MPRYRYEVKKAPGEATVGVIEAENERAALGRLREMGYFPISIREDSGEEKEDFLKRALVRIRLKDRNVFFRQLANLYESGMPLTRALSTIAEQTENRKMMRVVEQLREDVQKGGTFAEALAHHPKLFSPMCCSLVKAGESGGMLDEVLWRIVAFGEQDEEIRGKAVSALIYPAFLMFMGAVAVFILVSFVFPKFALVFKDFNATLPLLTRIVLGFCQFMGHFWWAVLGVFGASVYFVISYVRTVQGRMWLDTLTLRVPVVKVVAQKYAMGQFARTLGTLLDNGVPVLEALRITRESLGNKAVAAELEHVVASVAEGESISDGLRQASHFPPMVVNMFATGEESGRLGPVTKRMADAYDIEVDRAVKAMMSLLEPILIVIMGVLVGILVISMLLPMFTLSSNIT